MAVTAHAFPSLSLNGLQKTLNASTDSLQILLIASGVVNLARPRMMAMEWVQGALGILLFISPWVGRYSSEAGVAWFCWVGGVVTIVVAGLAMQPMAHMHHRTVAH